MIKIMVSESGELIGMNEQMTLTKEERKLILKHKIKVLQWDLSTYQSVKAMIKAIDEEINRINSVSMCASPPTDLVFGGRITGSKATEFDSAVEYVSITTIDFQSERKKFENVVKRVDKALIKLCDEDRMIIELFYIKGRTYNELADKNGYTKEGIRSKIRRIINKLSKIY